MQREENMVQIYTHNFACYCLISPLKWTVNISYYLPMQLQLSDYIPGATYCQCITGVMAAVTFISILKLSDSPNVSGGSVWRLLPSGSQSRTSWTKSQQLDQVLGWDRGGRESSFWSMLPMLSKKVTRRCVCCSTLLHCWYLWWL